MLLVLEAGELAAVAAEAEDKVEVVDWTEDKRVGSELEVLVVFDRKSLEAVLVAGELLSEEMVVEILFDDAVEESTVFDGSRNQLLKPNSTVPASAVGSETNTAGPNTPVAVVLLVAVSEPLRPVIKLCKEAEEVEVDVNASEVEVVSVAVVGLVSFANCLL